MYWLARSGYQVAGLVIGPALAALMLLAGPPEALTDRSMADCRIWRAHGRMVGDRSNPDSSNRIAADRRVPARGDSQPAGHGRTVLEQGHLPVSRRLHRCLCHAALEPASTHRAGRPRPGRQRRSVPRRRLHAGERADQYVGNEYVHDDDAAADCGVHHRRRAQLGVGADCHGPGQLPVRAASRCRLRRYDRRHVDAGRHRAERDPGRVHAGHLRHRDRLCELDARGRAAIGRDVAPGVGRADQGHIQGELSYLGRRPSRAASVARGNGGPCRRPKNVLPGSCSRWPYSGSRGRS